VTLSHQTTVRAFLEAKFNDNKGLEHKSMSELCFSCIVDWCNEIDLTEDGTPHLPIDELLKEGSQKQPLLDYAIRFWPDHLRIAGEPSQSSPIRVALTHWAALFRQRNLDPGLLRVLLFSRAPGIESYHANAKS